VIKKEYRVSDSGGAGERLDAFLRRQIPEMTRSQLRKLILQGLARTGGLAGGRIVKPAYRLKAGDRIEVEIPPSPPSGVQPEDLHLDILYADEHILIVDKPSGTVVHPGAGVGTGTLVNALVHRYPEIAIVGPEDRPGIVHRLDKETSGVMVVARTPSARAGLLEQFKGRDVQKIYLGLVFGRMPAREGTIDWPIGRHVRHGQRFSVKTRKPRTAETRYSVMREFKDTSLLEIRPKTGRTHQIRVHLATAGHPIAGDRRYGRRKRDKRFPRLFLHAHSLGFFHPATGEWVEFVSALAEDLSAVLKNLT